MRRVLGSVAFVACVLAVLDCEAIVSNDVPQFTCKATPQSAHRGGDLGCPPGQYCNGSGCVACEKSDVCDHFDNDCNGLIDDGPLSDRDADTFTECGQIAADRTIVDVDCNDDDPTVHPHATEVCNGVDDDCDNIVDNPDRVCPPNLICRAALQNKNPADNCVAKTSDCNLTPALCTLPQVCDQQTGKCVGTSANPIGSTCASDRECVGPGAFCGSSAYLGSITISGICTKTCCTSAECPNDFVCYASGTDGRYCVSKTLVGINNALGTLPAGAPASAPSQCRSGQETNGQCIDVCCVSSNCTNGTACHEGTLLGKSALLCQPGNATGSGGCCGGWACGGSPSNCGEGLCQKLSSAVSLCMAPCCGSAVCGGDGFGDYLCRAYQASNGVFTSCVATGLRRGGGVTGTDCNNDNECVGYSCAAGTATHSHKYCTDNCCTDNDCSNGTRCRPVSGNNAYILHCVYP